MKALSRSLVAAGIAVLGWAGAAQAAPVVANFTGPTNTAPDMSFDLGGGLSVTATAYLHDGGPAADAPFGTATPIEVYQRPSGLGAFNGPGDTSSVDGTDPEFLRFTFNQEVTLLSVVFHFITDNDQLDMAVDNADIDVVEFLGTQDLDTLPDGDFGASGSVATFADGGLTGTVFDFYTTDSNDNYIIRELLIETAADGGGDGDGDGGKDVSEPAALLLLGMAVASFCLARHRRC